MPKPDWSIIVHGGAGKIKPEKEEPSRKAALKAVEKGVMILREGGSALDAVQESVKILENEGVFNAGRGSVPRANGEVFLDASIMDGRNLAIGAIAGIQHIRHPISVARALLDQMPILLIGEHAMDFALQQGFKREEIKSCADESVMSCDTVGCAAMDMTGNFAVGLSTGGLRNALPGRVGDVPLPGCGFYADNERGGLCLSGDGESIGRVMLASEILRRLDKMNGERAIDEGLKLLEKVGGEAGCILIDKDGGLSWSHKSDHFTVAYQTSNDETPVVSTRKTSA